MRRILIGVVVVTLACVLVQGSMAKAGVSLDDIFFRGDADGNGSVELTDAISTLNWLYSGGNQPPCLAAADANYDGSVNGSDPMYTLNYLFSGGPAPYGTVVCP